MTTAPEWRRRTLLGFTGGLTVSLMAAAYAKARVVGQPVAAAASEAISEQMGQPVGLALLALPFAFLAFLAPTFALREKGPRRVLLVWLCALATAVFYFQGFCQAEKAMMNRQWTAAALSVGLLPFMSVAVLLGAAVVAVIAKALVSRRRLANNEPRTEHP